jgi:hypothetical protein
MTTHVASAALTFADIGCIVGGTETQPSVIANLVMPLCTIVKVFWGCVNGYHQPAAMLYAK